MKHLALLILVSFVRLSAQAPADLGQPLPEITPGEVQRIFDGYMIAQAPDALGLSDQQFAQFVPRLKILQDTRRRNQQERMRLLQELQRLTRGAAARGSTPDEAALKERLNALHELESRSAAELRKAYNGIDEILDVRQQARFRLFEEQIERKKLDLLMRARQNQGPNPNRPNANRPNLKRPPPVQ